MPRLRVVAAALVLAVVATACNYRTTGSPTGELDLVARFDDVQHLVVGHTVRMADVAVGTVTGLQLDGYTAVVEFSISDSHDIPLGTTASISSTSLLGENYVRLRPPDDPTSDIVEEGDELPTTGADASFEELTVKLLTLMRAIQGRDIATVIDESHAALVGRGDELNELIGTVDEVSAGLVDQTDDLMAVLDSLATFGEDVAADADLLGVSIEAAADATGALASQRERIVDTVAQLLDAAAALDTEVLAPHRARLDTILDRLTPVVDTLATNRDTLIQALEALRRTNERLPRAIDPVRDDVWLFGILAGVSLPDGSPILPGLLPLSGSHATMATLDTSPAAVIAQQFEDALGSPVQPATPQDGG